jgi:hypothetical protein
MNNEKFNVVIENQSDVFNITSKSRSLLKISYSDIYDKDWIKKRGVVLCKNGLLTFVGLSVITIELYRNEVPLELYELSNPGHYIFTTSNRYIHFHIMGATHINADDLIIKDDMSIDEIQSKAFGFSDIKPLVFICGLIL